MATQRRRLNRLNNAATAALVLPGAALGLLAALPPTPAQAQAPGAELKVLRPRAGDTAGSPAFSLDVAFHSRTKSPVTTAELWVDGVRWVHRDLDTPQIKNVLSFAVDASSLSAGTHDVVVKVFCANGASSQAQLQIAAGDADNATEVKPGAPEMSFRDLSNGRRVQGSVEVVLDAPAKNGTNPYITIYVDKQFKTLKNYPPYAYTWDTTSVANGYHTIEATGYLDSSTISTTRKMRVFVDNAGGNTTIQKDIADLSAKPVTSAAAGAMVLHPVKRLAKGAAATLRHTIFPSAGLKPAGEPVLSAAGVASVEAAASVRSLGILEPSEIFHPVSTTAAELPLAIPHAIAASTHHSVAAAVHLAKPAVHASATAIVPAAEMAAPAGVAAEIAPAPMASIASPVVALKPTAAPQLMVPAVMNAATTVAPQRLTLHTTTARHFGRHSSLRAHRGMTAAKAGTPLTSAAGPRTIVKPSAMGLLNLPEGSPFQVAFDGRQIAFDVQPRVEAGMPIAPFRQIFEHTGGQVEWHPQSHVVRAINADREVIITVGKNQAQVNGQNFTMDRAAFIERGRTIVPLSFVGQALDVNVKYDPATGHLEITSK